MFNYNRLHYFHVIANAGSIKIACERLNISQPALSIQLKQLEHSIGTNVFERKHRKLELTNKGKVLYSYTKKIFSLTAEASHELTGTNERTLKAINIGFVPSIFKGTIHEIIKPLWKSNCVLRIQQNPLPQLMEPFEEGKLDLIVATTHPGKLEKDWVVKRLGVRQLIIIGSPKYKSLRSNFPKSVESIPLITATETNPSRYAIDSFFERHKVQPNVIAEIDDPDLLSLALEDGYGIGVMSHNAAAELIHERRLIEIGEIYDVDSQLWAITHESSNPLVESAISKFKTAINRISK